MQGTTITIALQQTSIAEEIQFIKSAGSDGKGSFFGEAIGLGREDGQPVEGCTRRLSKQLVSYSNHGLQ